MLSRIPDKKQDDQLMMERTKFPVKLEAGNPFMVPQKFHLFIGKQLPQRVPFDKIADILPSKRDIYLEIFQSRQINLANMRLQRMPENLQLMDNLGISHLNSGDFDSAINWFQNALKINKDFFPSLANLAKTYFLKGEVGKALEIYLSLERGESTNVNVLMNIANILVAQKRLAEAQKYFEKVIELDKHNVAALNNMALLLLLEKKVDKAISTLRKATHINYRLPGLLNNLGVCFITKKNYKKAIRCFLTALSLNKYSREAALNLSRAYQEIGSNTSAIMSLEDYIEKTYGDQEAREALAWSYLQVKSYQKCLKQLNMSLKIAESLPSNEREIARLYNNIGVVYHRMQDFESAAKYYNSCFKASDVEVPVPFYNLIDLYFDQNKDELAKDVIDKCLSAFPDYPRGLEYLARYYFEVSDFIRSAEIAHRVIAMKPDLIASYTGLSAIEIEINEDFEKAHEILTKGLAIHPHNIALLNNLAYNYLMAGEIREAREILDKIEVYDEPHINATRGLLLIKEGNLKEGERLYNRAISLAHKKRELATLLGQKKYLELARYNYKEKRFNETRRLLRKTLSLTLKSKKKYFLQQAKILLEGLGMKK